MVPFFEFTTSLPVTRRKRSVSDLPWSNPCVPSGSEPADPSFPPGMPVPPTPSPPSIKYLLTELKHRISDSITISDGLKQAVFIHRLNGMLNLAEYLENVHYDGMPSISDIQEWKTSNDTGNVVIADFSSLSKTLVFMEQVKIDEIEFYNSSVKSHIIQTEDHLYSNLCAIKEVLSCLNLQIGSHVSRDIMPQSIREISVISDRHERDYIIVKDNLHFLHAAKANYVTILSNI